MNKAELPNDIDALKGIILQLTEENMQLTATNAQLAEEKELFKKRAAYLEAWIFARKTEKKYALQDPPEQLMLFNEAECHADEPEQEVVEEVPAQHAQAKRHGGRKSLPEELPRKEILIDIPDDQKVCACGTALKVIRKEVSEKLCIIPRKVYVERIVRPIYACPNCEGTETEGATVKIAPMPPQLIPHGIATPELVAATVIDKFCDALPLYRQSAIYKRMGIDIPRGTLYRWVLMAAEKCRPLYEQLFADLTSGHVMHMDETRVQVLKEANRSDALQSVMWVMCGGNKGNVRYFHYDPSHAGAVARELLKDFTGYLMTDGLKAYESVGERTGLTHVSCLVHMRRKFAEVAKTAGKNRKKGVSDHFLDYVAKLYHKEKQLRKQLESNHLSIEDFVIKRKSEQVPILESIKKLLDDNIALASPKSSLGDALSYALRHWERMIRYLDCAELTPDNNEAENAIRPFAVGRKNWLFAGSPRGAEASALFYTLIESAKANDVNAHQYLVHVLRNIASADTPEKKAALLPWNCKDKLE